VLAHNPDELLEAQPYTADAAGRGSLDYQQDLAVYAEERRQSDQAEAELRRLFAIRRQV